MNKYFSYGMIGIAGALSVMTGMDHKRFSSTFGSIVPEVMHFSPEHNVVVTAKTFTPDESKFLLGHDLISRGVVPVQVNVQNNTANEYSLCASSVDLPHIDPNKVAFKVSKSAIPRAIGWKILSFLFWPLMIPSTIDGIRTYTHHRNLKKDFNAKSLKEKGEVISPYSTFHRILFVPKDGLKETFAVTVIDIETMEQTSVETQLSKQAPVKAADEAMS
ncbi:MAG: hypothetical protein JSR93_08890 [Verrucomicrobia bacterium]|nr:hypothetical protein [Verrucomicrobiota bacterium]